MTVNINRMRRKIDTIENADNIVCNNKSKRLNLLLNGCSDKACPTVDLRLRLTAKYNGT